MRVFLNASGGETVGTLFPEIGPLRCVLDTPMVQLVLEGLVNLGLSDFHVLLGDQGDRVQSLLQDGRRWGIRIKYYAQSDFREALGAMDSLPCLAGPADRWPQFELPSLPPEAMLMSPQGWTGWTLLSRKRSLDLPRYRVDGCWDTRTLPGLLAANMEALGQGDERMLLRARQISPGVWCARGARIDPGAVLRGPLYLGADVTVREGSILGPWTVIGNRCLIDQGTEVVDSVVGAHTYVGRDLEIRTSLVAGHRLYHRGLDTELALPDRHLLGDVRLGWRGALRLWKPRVLRV